MFFILWVCLSVYCFQPALNAQSETGQHDGIAYKSSIEGIVDGTLLKELKSASDLFSLKSRLPSSIHQLRRRAERDKRAFLKILKARGYYGSKITSEIALDIKPVQVVVKIETGPYYLIQSVEYQLIGTPGIEIAFPEGETIGLFRGVPLEAAAVESAQARLIYRIKKQGFPFPTIQNREIIIKHLDHSAMLTFFIDPGARTCFGLTQISGLASVNEAFVRKMIPWETGDPYNPDLMGELKKRMIASGLFSTVQIIPQESTDNRAGLPVIIKTSERAHRSIGFEINYQTDENLGATALWEHRNFFQKGENVTLTAGGSNFTRDFDCRFKKSYFFRSDQTLNLKFIIAEEDPDAYKSRSIESIAHVERELNRENTIGVGLGFKLSKVEQIVVEEDYRLCFLPVHFRRDTGDDLFDPTRGYRLNLRVAPYYDLMSSDSNFLKGSTALSHYLPVFKKPLLVFASRVKLGAITGSQIQAIPANERFYAGGGGSVRGYAYQYVGPLLGEDPIGGRSLLEVSGEVRLRLTNRFGIVGFLDGGNVYFDSLPDTREDLLWGAGLGLRYNTPIGPLRFDVGFPLDRRDDVDDKFQIYISVGQAF